MSQRHRCIIAFGGNLGDPDETFRRAFSMLEQAGLVIEKISTVISSEPVGCEQNAPTFRNGVLTAFWTGSPYDLLALCQRTEAALGRPNDHPKSVSRTLDLDVILFDDLRSDDPRLTLPHPRAKERDFVLAPLREIAPELVQQLMR